MINESELRQNGKVFLRGDSTSIHIIFNNMTGTNFGGDEYEKYKEFVESQGADLSASIELFDNGTLTCTGNFHP